MSNIFTLSGSNGREPVDVQPVANSVAGSPFTSGAASAPTPAMTGLAIIVVVTDPIHVRFDKGTAVAADGNDMLFGIGEHRVPCDDHVMSFIQDAAPGTVYVETARNVGT